MIQQRATGAGFLAVFAFCVLALPIAGATAAQARGRIVDCHVESAGKVQLSGKCRFMPDKGGSFWLENVDRDKPLFGEIELLSVTITSPGIAEVSGLTIRHNSSRWGTFRRSTSDSACWQDSESKICAG